MNTKALLTSRPSMIAISLERWIAVSTNCNKKWQISRKIETSTLPSGAGAHNYVKNVAGTAQLIQVIIGFNQIHQAPKYDEAREAPHASAIYLSG